MAAQPPTPGWYPDPGGQPATQRWWDGDTWSHVTRPAPDGAAVSPAAPVPGAPAAAGVQTTPDGVPLAGYGARVLARVVDAILTGLVSYAAGSRLLRPAMDGVQDWLDRVDRAVQQQRPVPPLDVFNDVEVQRQLSQYLLLTLLVGGVYTVLLLKLRGATLGKRLAGIRVRSWEHEGPLTWGQALGRWLTGEGVAGIPALNILWRLANYLWPLWDRRRQALHDKLPGTVVVKAARTAPPPVAAPWP